MSAFRYNGDHLDAAALHLASPTVDWAVWVDEVEALARQVNPAVFHPAMPLRARQSRTALLHTALVRWLRTGGDHTLTMAEAESLSRLGGVRPGTDRVTDFLTAHDV